MSSIQKYTVNGHSVWRGRLNKINGQNIDNGPHFTIRPLSTADTKNMGKLSAEIYRHLGSGEECFIHKHEPSYYHQAVQNPDNRYIGIFVGEQLVAMSYLKICRNHQQFSDEIPNSPLNFFNTPNTRIAALGADSVLPTYRGNNLNQIMIDYRLELAKNLHCNGAASIIDRSNHWNMPPYFNNGFRMYATAIDPADGGKIALMHHNLKTQTNLPQRGVNVPFASFNLIDKLLAKGYVGCGYNKDTATLTFVQTAQRTPVHGIEQNIMFNSLRGKVCNM